MLTGELDACVASHKVQLQCSGRSAVLSLSTGHDSHRGVDRSSSSVNLASAYPEGAAVEGRRASQDHWRSVQHRMQPLVLQQEVLASLDLHHHSAVATRMSECSAKTHARFDDAMQTEIKATSEAVRQALCKGHGVDPSTGVQVLHVDALERTVQVALKAGEDFVLDALGKAHLEAYKEAGQHVKTLVINCMCLLLCAHTTA